MSQRASDLLWRTSLDTDAMGITMLKMDHAKVKWRLKLQAAFQKSQHVQGECRPSY